MKKITITENSLKNIIKDSIKNTIDESSINAKKRTINNVVNAFQKGKRGYNAIKTMAIFTAENPDSTKQNNTTNTKLNHSLLNSIKNGNYVAFQVKGHFGNVEHPYLVLNISVESAAYFAGKFEQTSFIYHILNDNGIITSQYWEKKNEFEPYNKKTNPYVKKDESDEWINQKDADDFYTVIGKNFKYSIPFQTLMESNNIININLNKIRENKNNISKDKLLEFSMNKIGQAPYYHRGIIYKGLI